MRSSALISKIDALLGRPFLEHDADGVNDFLIHSRAAMDDHVIPRELKSAWRLHVTILRDRARRSLTAHVRARFATMATCGDAR
jgi:hypothetical protein